jgi:hypothetical protein
MGVISRIAGSLLITCAVLLILKFGFSAIFAIYQQCNASLSTGGCKTIQVVLSSLLVFFTGFLGMRVTNRLWGKNVFKSRAK